MYLPSCEGTLCHWSAKMQMMNRTPKIVLASQSPQRKTLLESLGVQFTIAPSSLNESTVTEEDPAERAKILARLKAQDVARTQKHSLIIGCDTLVVAEDGTLLEKPAHEKEARTMLGKLSGHTCIVHSALCIVAPDGKLFEGISSSSVTFKAMMSADIDWWMRTGLWQDRSGAFQIDGLGQFMIERIEGEYASIVGFPVFLFGQLMEKAGASPYMFE